MRTLAWLNAVPDPPEGQTPVDGEMRQSRGEQIREAGGVPSIPEAPLPYLVAFLFDVGPVLPGAMGPVALTHSELRAWQTNTGVDLSPWEAKTLRALSAEYAAESQAATKYDAPKPGTPKQSNAALVAKRMQSRLAQMAKE